MALSGLHVACTFIGDRGLGGGVVSLVGAIAWAETLASAGTTTNAAPTASSGDGAASFELRSSVEAWVSWGATPNAGAGQKRILLPAGETRNVFAKPGDKVAWAPA